MRRTETVLTGAAIGMALIEATTAQARPMPTEGMRVSTRNTPAPSGDMYQAGRELLAAGDVTGAMAAFRQALIEAPQSIDALNGLGVCYDRLGRYDIGRGYYDAALAIDPDSTLVLNNLGYSLYLQGEYAAAIPILQRAGGSTDPAVVAASQRVLAMVADEMREAAATDGARLAIADVAIRGAHIEVATDGEQRLVFGSIAPDNALLSALGDDAALVTIAAPQRDKGWPVRIDTGAVSQRGDDILPAIIYLTSSAGTAHSATLVLADDTDNSVPIARTVTTAPIGRVIAAPPATPASVRTIVADARPSQQHQALPIAPRQRHADTIMLPVPNYAGDRIDRGEPPAWLLSSRRSDLPTTGRAGIGQGPQQGAVAAFESDLVELNRFAARMRGTTSAAPVAEPTDTAVDRDVALARLEALLARVRQA